MDPLVAETQEPYGYAGDNPVNASDLSGKCWSLALGVQGPCLPPPDGVPYDGSFDMAEISIYPQVLSGMNPQDVLDSLGGVPEGWAVSPAGGKAAPGWKMYEVRSDGSRPGNRIRWNWTPNSPGHPEDEWQWTVNVGRTQNVKVSGGDWPDGPEEYVGNTGGYAGRGGTSSGSDGDGQGGTGESPGEDPGVNPCEASVNSRAGTGNLVGCGLGAGGLGGGDPFDLIPGVTPDPIEIPAGLSQPCVAGDSNQVDPREQTV